jgi:hypothetical protein
MLTQAIAILALSASAAPQEPTAKDLIQKMLGRYYAAKTLVGKIRLTVSTETGSASLDTVLQYERPAKLYIKQQKSVANPDPEVPSTWLVTSDGNTFSYQVPNDRYAASPGLRLVEPVHNQRVNVTQDIGSIYAASSKSIGDRSTPLDIAISARSDLAYRRDQWMNYRIQGTQQMRGKNAYLVVGDFREYAGALKSGTYRMAITADGELLQYAEEIHVAVEAGHNPKSVRVMSVWDVDLQIDGKVDPALFRVVVR